MNYHPIILVLVQHHQSLQHQHLLNGLVIHVQSFVSYQVHGVNNAAKWWRVVMFILSTVIVVMVLRSSWGMNV